MSNVKIDLKSFNDDCKKAGKTPFPFDSVELDIQDETHYKLTIRNFEDALNSWWKNRESTESA